MTVSSMQLLQQFQRDIELTAMHIEVPYLNFHHDVRIVQLKSFALLIKQSHVQLCVMQIHICKHVIARLFLEIITIVLLTQEVIISHEILPDSLFIIQ